MNIFTLFASSTDQSLSDAVYYSNSSSDVINPVSGSVAAGFGIFFVLIWFAVMALGIASFVLWIISLIHVFSHQDIKDRILWIVILLVAGTVGGVVYFFAVKKPYDKGGMRELPHQPPQPPQAS